MVSSRYINEGYLNRDSPGFTKSDDGRVTFRTGDIYQKQQGYLIWKGRKDDYIQVCQSSFEVSTRY